MLVSAHYLIMLDIRNKFRKNISKGFRTEGTQLPCYNLQLGIILLKKVCRVMVLDV